MATVKALDLERLPEHARTELSDFYSFLVKKYGGSVKKKYSHRIPSDLEKQKSRFFEKVASHVVTIPSDYQFNRDELHER